MNVTTTTTIQCRLKNGTNLTLTTADCASIINALSRRRMLNLMVESIPADLEQVWTEEVCAWESTAEDGSPEVAVSVDASAYVCGTPRKRAKSKKKSSR